MQGPQKPTRVKSVIPHSEKVVNAEQHESLPLLALALVIRRFLEIADECLQFTRNTPVAHSIYDMILTVNSICTLAYGCDDKYRVPCGVQLQLASGVDVVFSNEVTLNAVFMSAQMKYRRLLMLQ